MTQTAAYPQLQKLVSMYSKVLPTWTWPWVSLALAAVTQFFAWFGGSYLFPGTILPLRVLGLWLIAAIEYMILIPGIGASVEVLKISESTLAVIIHAFQLVAFFILNRFTLKANFTLKHAIAFALMIVAVFIVAF